MVYILFLYTINPINRMVFFRKIILKYKQGNLSPNKEIFINRISREYILPQMNNASNNINDNENNNNNTNDTLHVNKGTGAGGSNTNLYGKKFEEKTNNETRLIEQGFSKISLDNKNKNKKAFNYYLFKKTEDKKIIFVLQSGLKMYMKQIYNIELFRCPDEAYIFEYNDGTKIIKILEKKEQCVEGSVETKLWSGPSLKREYELILGDHFIVHYGFCVSSFLKQKFVSNEKKYNILSQILNENNITVLFGDDIDYFDNFDKWLNNFE
jgi:hypothetical protein